MKKINGFALLFAICVLSNTLWAQENKSRIVENGGTGNYSAVMMTESSLPTHTIFRPQDMSAFGKKNKLLVNARVATAWYKWQLNGDDQAGELFTGNPCGLSKAQGWTVDKKNIP